MSVPEHLWRFPTSDARVSLAARFNLQYTDKMQDWEYEVSDLNRISEFLTSYKADELTDDEKFSLMEIIIQSFADLNKELTNDLRWQDTIHVIINNLDTHIYTVWYWSGFEEQHEYYCVSRHMKEIRDSSLEKYA